MTMTTLHAVDAHADERARKPLPRPIRLAVTVDDLPAVVDANADWSRSRILNQITSVLRAHRVPEPVGFINGANMDADPVTRAALEAWLGAGFVLGNHTFLHLSADQVGAAVFERDIEHDQTLIVELAGHEEHAGRYFRYPYLERGGTRDERRIRRYLAQHKYRIADVSVDFQDWAFSAAYARCHARGDGRSLAALEESYLSFALAELYWSVETVQRLLGRSAPQVLLVHANFMTAQMLDRLLTEYERAGVRFIALQEALADGIYAQAQTGQHGDTTLVAALVRERRAHVRAYVPLPDALLNAICGGPD
jgi:peptidoglycan/xylan/chitin deacetylase (PgdA/CDA1 family)